jgi:hypothetical protein
MVIQMKPDRARILADIDGDKRFFCQNGCVIQNLTELIDCLNQMTEEVFRHHVTSEKNDFCNWIRDVLGDEKLAGELYSASNPPEAIKIVMERLASFQRNRNKNHRLKIKR